MLFAAGLVRAQEHNKCMTGPAQDRDQKSRRPLYALPTDYLDSIVSPSRRFAIYYNETVPDGTTPIDFVRRAAEECDSAYEFEINQLGYSAPELTDGAHYRFFLTPLHRAPERAYGATLWLDDAQLPNAPSGTHRTRSFCEIENSFPDSVYATTGYDALRVTIFHEFFHMIQFSGYGMPPSVPNYIFFQEMSSAWMEMRSTPNVKDYLQYVKYYLKNLELRFDAIPDLGIYGQYLYLAYLSNRYGDTIVRECWENYRDKTNDPITAIDLALAAHGTTWCNEYEKFGAELVSGSPLSATHDIPDAAALPIASINVHHVTSGSSQDISNIFALSLTFAETIGSSTCDVVIARDTDRRVQSTVTISASSSGAATVHMDDPQRYCDTTLCSSSLAVLPNPFVITEGHSDTALFFASSRFERPISTVLDIYSIRREHIRNDDQSKSTLRANESWYASWDGRDDLGKPVEIGEYIYKLSVDGALKIGKIVLVRKH
jgi:hypothetical protein